MTGTTPDKNVQVVDNNYTSALAGESDDLYIIGPSNDPSPQPVLKYINLVTGDEFQIMEGRGGIVTTKDERYALVRMEDSTLWFLQKEQVTKIAENITTWRTPYHVTHPYPEVYHGENIVPIVTASSLTAFSLSILDASSRKLYLLSNHLYFDEDAWNAGDLCQNPNVVPNFGYWGIQTHFYFYEIAENPDEVSLFLVPTDFSTPPSFFMNVPVETCVTPRISTDGTRTAIVIEDPSTKVRTLYHAPLP